MTPRERLFIYAALLVVVITASCASISPRVEPPQVTLEAVRILRIAESKADISMRLRLANPNDFALSVESIAFEITLDRRPAAGGRSTHVDILPAHGEANIDVSGRVDIGAIATALMTLGSQLRVDYTVNGSATLTGGTILQFSRKGQIPVVRFDRPMVQRPQ